jgi:thiol-disulfide isomerase/thioredoxin
MAIAAAVVAVLAVAAVIASTFGGEDTITPGVEQTRPVAVAGDALPAFGADPDPAIGLAAPTLTGESFDGRPVSIAPSAGPMAIWFVAHWCPHCQAEVPRIVDLAEQGRLPDGVEIAAVSTAVDETGPNYPPSAWFDREAWPFPVMADDAEGTAAAAYGLQGFPFLVLVDADGIVTLRTSGELGDDGIVAALESLT